VCEGRPLNGQIVCVWLLCCCNFLARYWLGPDLLLWTRKPESNVQGATLLAGAPCVYLGW
jgi:hypothetical protein